MPSSQKYRAVSSESALFHHLEFNLMAPFHFAFNTAYIFAQKIIIALFKPCPPKSPKHPLKPFGRIAVIGTGLTGVSSAAHAIAHNFDVTIYESNPRSGLGGIWTHENTTSGLQINSLLYRFHPAVLWRRAFPLRDEIVGQITKIWEEYHLDSRTKFNTRVTSVRRAPNTSNNPAQKSRWLINDGADGPFDAVIVTVGTCGKPKWIKLEGMPEGLGQEGTNENVGVVKDDGVGGREVDRQDEKEDDAGVDGKSAEGGADSARVNSRSDAGDEYDRDERVKPLTPVNEETETEGGTPESANRSPVSEQKHTETRDTIHSLYGSKQPAAEATAQDAEMFTRPIVHSSQLDSPVLRGEYLRGKRVVVVGSGASGVEAVETILERMGGAGGEEEEDGKVWMVARGDKWIIPRNIVIDTFLACQPFGREMPWSFMWESFLKQGQYRGVEDLVPADRGIFEGTPVVNDAFLPHVRSGRCVYVRGDPLRLNKRGVVVNRRARGVRRGEEGVEEVIEADLIVLATGYEKPDIGFLDPGLFPEGYERPDLYLQNFSTEDWSILLTNSAYVNAIGTVGHFHIGIYTRILLTLLLDENARPTPKDMKLWVDVVRFVKRGARGGALGFFTYMELMIWLMLFHVFRPDRLRWLFFIMQGWGVYGDERGWEGGGKGKGQGGF